MKYFSDEKIDKTIFILSGSVNDILDELNGEDEMRDSRSFQHQEDDTDDTIDQNFSDTPMNILASKNKQG